MPTSTEVPIYTTTLSSSATTIDIDLSSHQSYTNIKIVASMKLLGADGIRMRLGNTSLDTGSNYSFTYMYGTGGAKGSFNGNNNTSASIGDGMSNSFGVFNWHIMNYSRTDCHKTILSKTGTPTRDVQVINNLWRSNSPIKMISMYTEGSGFAAGTTISVYGIGTASIATKATGGAVYSDSTYMYHVFTASGLFTPTQSLSTDVLVVAGGGGGASAAGGGGGAGGLLVQYGRSCSSGTAYTVTVGAGGAASSGDGGSGGTGGSSVFDTIGANGGGGGAHNTTGLSGGSGGGGGYGVTSGGSATQGNSGGATGYGYAGGGNSVSAGLPYSAGGGGGAGAAGGTGNSSQGGNGGDGRTEAFFNAIGLATGAGETVNGFTYFAGGGGGSRDTVWGTGGLGGGGKGGSVINASTNSAPTKGKINTGGGGGGGNVDGYYNGPNSNAGVPGGSGIVIVRYEK